MDKEREELPENKSNQGSEEQASSASEEKSNTEASQSSEEQGSDEMEQQVDYSNFSKGELVEAIEKMVTEDQMKKYDESNEIKSAFDELEAAEKQEALDKFIEEGGDKDAFDFKGDDLNRRFHQAYRTLKERRSKHYAELEKNRQNNLKAKHQVLDRIRELVDAPETNTSMEAIKKLQEEWKAIGQVPGSEVQELWANYNALMDRFYNNRSIYFELKELDRKKNLDAKLELCKKAEELVELEDIREASNQLNELHEEFKNIGPVPKEEQEALWQRFKAASDKVYDKRKVWLEDLKKEFQANQEVKEKLIEEIKPFLDFDSDRIKEWNNKTKELLDIQAKWEAIGGVPKENAKEINKAFWGVVKGFFRNKNNFFMKLEGQRKENLKLKDDLVAQAESIKDSTDWGKTVAAMKGLQAQWKKIGPVPEKQREEMYVRFKAAADHFFNRMREKNQAQEQEFVDNYKQKEEICDKIEAAAKGGSVSMDELKELDEAYRTIGFVPRDKVKESQQRYTDAVSKYIDAMGEMSEEEKQDLMLRIEFGAFKDDPSARRKMQQKENDLRKKINDIENDITTWKNNLEFFARSATAEKLRKDFDEKIAEANKELKALKKQLNMLRKI